MHPQSKESFRRRLLISIGLLILTGLYFIEQNPELTLICFVGAGVFYWRSRLVKNYINCVNCSRMNEPTSTQCAGCGRNPKEANPVPYRSDPVFLELKKRRIITAVICVIVLIGFLCEDDANRPRPNHSMDANKLKRIVDSVDFDEFQKYWDTHPREMDFSMQFPESIFYFRSPLCLAAHQGKKMEVEFLLAHSYDPNLGGRTSELRCVPVLAALSAGHIDIVDVLAKAGAKLDYTDTTGNSFLHQSVLFGQYEALRYFLAKSLPVNRTNLRNRTALHLAVLNGYTDMVQLLIKNGADSQAKDGKGSSAVDFATRQKRDDLLVLLQKRTADNP